MASNPVTSGFVQGMTVQVSGFSGADTYFNAGTLANGALTNGLPILSVTPTTITVSLVHANANATTNGSLVQIGNSVTPCAGLATIYTDASLVTTTTNPFLSDSLGNYDASVPTGIYYVQVYGSSVTTTLRQITVPIVSGAAVTFANINNILYVDGIHFLNLAAALATVPAAGALIIDPFVEAFTVNPFASTTNPVLVQFGAGIWTTTVPIITSANQWITGAGPQFSKIKAVAGFASTTQGVITLGTTVENHAMYVRDIGIDCNSIANCTGLVFDGAQNPAGASNVVITNYRVDGVRLQQTVAATSGVKLHDMWAYSPTGTAPSGAGVNVSAFSGTALVENFTQASDHSFPGPSAFKAGGGSGEFTCINCAGEGITDQFLLTGTAVTTTIIGASQQASSSPGVNTVHVGAGVSNYNLINVSQGNSTGAALVDDQRTYTCAGGIPFLVVSGGTTKFDFGTCSTIGWIRTPATTVTTTDLIQLQAGFSGTNTAQKVLSDAGATQWSVSNDGRPSFRGNQSGAFTQILASDVLTVSRTAQYPNGPSATVMVAALVTTAAATDNVTIQGMTASGHCSLTPTNAAAIGAATPPGVTTKAANQITVTHAVTANMNYDVMCTSN
jgi:hypothetical protein